MRKFFTLSLLTLVLAACSYTDGGVGNRALTAEATVHYDFAANNFYLQVYLTKDGAAVSEALVTMKDEDSGQLFTLEQDPLKREVYRYSTGGYFRNLRLEVEAGSDKFWAQLEGPAHFVILTPEQNGKIKLENKKDLKITWRADDGLPADNVYISFKNSDLDVDLNRDEGVVTVAMKKLTAGPEEVAVARCNKITLAGAAEGSTFEICYDLYNNFQLIN